MKIRTDSWYSKWFEYFYGYLPPTLCPFFWLLLCSFFLAPLVSPSLFWKQDLEERFKTTFGILFAGLVLLLLSVFIYDGFHTGLAFGLVRLGCILAIPAIVILVVIGIEWKDRRDMRRAIRLMDQQEESSPSMFKLAKTWIKAKYDKACPIIEWVEPKHK